MRKWKKLDVTALLAGVYAERSVISYEVGWRKYMEYCTNRDPFCTTTFVEWRQQLIADGYAAASINAFMTAVLSIAKELYARRDITRNEYFDLKEVRKLPARALKERRRPFARTRITPDEMRKICDAPVTLVDGNPLALRDRAMMLTLATSGLRITECCHVKFNDIRKLGHDSYVIENVAAKYHDQPRTVPLSPEAYEAILDWIEFRPIQSPYVFTGVGYTKIGEVLYHDKPLNSHTAQSRIRKYGIEVGIPHVKPHDFRRFVGTQLAKKSIRQAQKVLGHKSPATTSEHYILDDVEVGITDGLF